MTYQGYREDELISNRAALLLYAGSEGVRRAWAEEAAAQFPNEGPLVVVTSALVPALERSRGVVYVVDVLALGYEGQGLILRGLREKEERPKWVLGLSSSPADARRAGTLRDDLAYRLDQAQVNLGTPGLKDVLRARRMKAQGKGGRAANVTTTPPKAAPGRREVTKKAPLGVPVAKKAKRGRS